MARADLRGIAALSSGEAWAVGQSYISHGDIASEQAVGAGKSLMFRFDDGEQSWKTVSIPQISDKDNVLNGVAALSANDVWAVGTFGKTDQYNYGVSHGLDQGKEAFRWSEAHTLTMHWDGKEWRVVRSPDPDPAKSGLNSVYSSPSGEVWAVGWTHPPGSNVQLLLLRWDGASWTVIPSPVQVRDILALRIDASDSVLAVGSDFSDNGELHLHVLRWDGVSWTGTSDTVVTSDTGWNIFRGGGKPGPQGTVILEPDDAWAVGTNADMKSTSTVTAHWDGYRWTSVPSPDWSGIFETRPFLVSSYLTAVSAVAPDDVWAVGSWGDRAIEDSYQKPFALHWDGAQWKIELDSMPTFHGSKQVGLNAVSAVKGHTWALGEYIEEGSFASVPFTFRRREENCGGVSPIYVQPTPTENYDHTVWATETFDPQMPTYHVPPPVQTAPPLN